MRLLVIGYALPHPSIDNYHPFTAPSFFDYDAVVVDATAFTSVAQKLVVDGESFDAHDGRPVVNAPTSASAVSAAELLRRRAQETQRLLEAGGTIVVLTRPNAVQAGVAGFEGCDRYSWLPAPAGVAWGPPLLRAAEGKTVRIVAEDHAFTPVLRDYRTDIVYRAVFDDRHPAYRQHARTIAAGGAGAPIAAEFRVLEGRVLFLPVFPDHIGAFRSTLADRIVDAMQLYIVDRQPRTEAYWERSIAVPGLEQDEAALETARAAAERAEAELTAAEERVATSKAHRRLITTEGHDLAEAARDALTALGFIVTLDGNALTATGEGQTAFVECEGAREEVVEWPYVRLQRRIETHLLAAGEAPKGIVIANGQRVKEPGQREAPFTTALRLACENYRYTLLTGETLFALLQRALGGADEAFLTGARRRMLAGAGVLTEPEALGITTPEAERDPDLLVTAGSQVGVSIMVKIIRPNERDRGTAQTPGMRREAGVSAALCGSEGLWMGTAVNDAGQRSGVHHHGANESAIYILRGRVRFRWGEKLEHVVDTEPGDFIFVPPFEVHMEENLDVENEAELLLARNSQEQIVVNVPDPRDGSREAPDEDAHDHP